ncbi:SGNH/GDSL hydrolase family protein [Kamptonema formosum]|uniref:SGNH/GDSL hydrolase family protein n=1 Tax=Kamptonema formosum TaxID=331992 RepID=UPI001E28E7F4|nr:DUF459 domain-containing protein [Oscillatoria sp. PCC 10802]
MASSQFATAPIKEAAQKVKVEGFRKREQEFWSDIKTVNFDIDREEEEPEADAAEKAPESQPEKQPVAPKQTEKPKPQPAQIKAKAEKPYSRFLFVGDSIMFDLATAVQYSLQKSYNITQTKLAYKVSTGLNRTDYYDWYARTGKLLKSYKPDVLVVMFGGNDNQDIRDFQGKYRVILTDDWKKAYRARVDKYAKLVSASPSIRKVYFVGHPKTGNVRYYRFFNAINQIYRDVANSYPKVEFVDAWNAFSVGGKYAPIVADKSGHKGYVRVSDGVHFTAHGARIMSALVLDNMSQDKVLKAPSKPAKK